MTDTTHRPSFTSFYYEHFLHEHRNPANIALHMIGVLASAGILVASVAAISPWWALLFPPVFVLPGLLGHRLFEREAVVGDLRIVRTDFPLSWFLVGNVMLSIRVLSFGKFF